jgi:hypothetical protein
MFGMAPNPLFTGANTSFTGDQVRGSGFLHDGSIPTIADFLSADVFNGVSSRCCSASRSCVVGTDDSDRFKLRIGPPFQPPRLC